MIKVIGKEGCSQCVLVKNLLTSKGVEFNYLNLYTLPQEEQDNYINIAQQKGLMQLPLIIDDNEFVSLQELISRLNK